MEDYQQLQTQPQPQVHMPPEQVHTHQEGRKGKKAGLILLVIILIAAAAFGGWYYRDMQAKKQLQAKADEISSLTQAKSSLSSQLEQAKKTNQTTVEATIPSAANIDTIKTAVTKKDYASLKDLLSTNVVVTIAASDGLGMRTQAQAITDLKYLDSATTPWNFSLPAATISQYQKGKYGAYFPDGVVVGTSKDNKLAAFSFNGAGKITNIFMASSTKLVE